MTTAIIIIAICEIIRILQNALQLMKLYSSKDFMLKLAEIASKESDNDA